MRGELIEPMGWNGLELECTFVPDGLDLRAMGHAIAAAGQTLRLPCILVPDGCEDRPGYSWIEAGWMMRADDSVDDPMSQDK